MDRNGVERDFLIVMLFEVQDLSWWWKHYQACITLDNPAIKYHSKKNLTPILLIKLK